MNNKYLQLGDGNVLTMARQIPEQALKQQLSTVPQFYQHQSIAFTDLELRKCNEM
ncbi:hypothetical protein PCANC_16590 [Puccinia coronata f. sp. avenae]|uniref:Uncharacterized protein n=1 Tax=Puccinia coronata f. sp. avenae TaxID=200324 RepID=A0A2N5UM25_9BASI|nr:hypothetical protein PCANC_16590 [Puccinia coronata f. sp. avenae]